MNNHAVLAIAVLFKAISMQMGNLKKLFILLQFTFNNISGYHNGKKWLSQLRDSHF